MTGNLLEGAAMHLSTGKRDLIIDPPWTNAAGFLGFSDEARRTIDASRLGALVTNPVSLRPRSPASGPRFFPYPGGFLLHTGHPNPGLRSVLQRHRRRWGSLPRPVILHLIADDPQEFVPMLEMLESVEEVAGVEIGLQARSAEAVASWLTGMSSSQIPIVACLPLDVSGEAVVAARRAGAAAISLGPPRGALHAKDGQIVNGRLYGPALLPKSLERVGRLRELVDCPLIAGGGIYSRADLDAALRAGAAGVQLDAVLWTEPEAVLNGISP